MHLLAAKPGGYVDDEGYAILLVEGDVPAELEEKAQLTMDNCPEFTIELG